jgi:lysine/ornithine N-monooxygenase
LLSLAVCATYNVPEPWKGRLVAGQSGSEVFLGIHMGKPEKDVTLGLSSSAVKKGASVFPMEKTAFGSLMRTVGPEAIFMVPAAKSRDSMKPLLRPSKN